MECFGTATLSRYQWALLTHKARCQEHKKRFLCYYRPTIILKSLYFFFALFACHKSLGIWTKYSCIPQLSTSHLFLF
jgi:hypothetical protein